ncbi:rhodanese-like domain-containing protein [Longispora albida]|uniref:rhodanese-like domain-containing protein n=1 Tax=Longispora albida TaxID=203523 RepID=UPI000365DEBE|nr:rhodanese-like domain-containing protein [Longispora albida]
MTTLITREELATAVEAGTVVLVDALGAAYHAQRHIPGAVPLAPGEAVDLAAGLLPDRQAAIVTYCSNAACPNSGQVADQLTALGYTNVRKYREGIEDWAGAGLPLIEGQPTQ